MTKNATTALALLRIALLAWSLHGPVLWSRGIPFIRNYSAAEYGGHNHNFDVISDDAGRVYVANFEGLLYYDNARWHMLHTKGVTRITTLFRDAHGTIWTGGYNYIGSLKVNAAGLPQLNSIEEGKTFHGEVQWIWEKDGQIFFLVSDKKIYTISGKKVGLAADQQIPDKGASVIRTEAHVNQRQQLDYGMAALATEGSGVIITDEDDNTLFTITTDNGLCSNNVKFVTYNRHGQIWGATDNGVFCIAFPSIYSHITPREGLTGEVLALQVLNGTIYAGTRDGLFRQQATRFVKVKGIDYSCHQLAIHGDEMLAATADGVYKISKDGRAARLTVGHTLSLLTTDDGYYTGQTDGIYFHHWQGGHRLVSNIEKVTAMKRDNAGTIWIENLYGRIWLTTDGHNFRTLSDGQQEDISTLVEQYGLVMAVKATDEKPFPYPAFSFCDQAGTLWLTDNKGKSLYAMNQRTKDERLSKIVSPLKQYSVRTLLRTEQLLWMGGDQGINVVDYQHEEPTLKIKPTLYIRSVTLNGSDSTVWGGFGQAPAELPTLRHDERSITINFSIDFTTLLQNTRYRTRLNGGNWSSWDDDTSEEFHNLPAGHHLFEVQALDAYGRTTDVVGIGITILPPWYERWYMILAYNVMVIFIIFLLVRWRLHRLEKEKLRLENIVGQRTAEVVKQRDEIEEKSKRLETALGELAEAQHELVRQEKMATVGKLTQGLIDRILNPLNYINNFAKLSQGLLRDVKANVDDEQEHMDADNYDDTIELLQMLDGNLQKVTDHGINTTRTLKAMEEVLKDRSGGMTTIDLAEVIRQDEKIARTYYADDFSQLGLSIDFAVEAEKLPMNGNSEQLSKTLMSLVDNAVYAVKKQQQALNDVSYKPHVSIVAKRDGQRAIVIIRDNGTGIPAGIVDKVFDPFYTTKTTAEAAGVGLYLSREIIQNHGGDISVRSEQGKYTEFTIVLPIII